MANPIAPYTPETDRDELPAYAERDGTHFRVRVTESTEVTLDRWEFWCEAIGDPPDDVDDDPTASLSGVDEVIADDAISRAISASLGDREQAGVAHGERGVVYYDPLDPDESGLVPEPPFEYARVEPESHVAPSELYLRAHADHGTVTTTRYVHETTPITDSRTEFEAHLREHHVDATFDSATVDESVADILAELDRGQVHDERPPLSEGFEALLERLDLDDVASDESGDRVSRDRYYEHDGTYHNANFSVS